MEDGTGREGHDDIGRLVEDFGRGCQMLNGVGPVVEYVVQELQELTEFNEKKLKSTTDEGLNLARRRRERRSRPCAGRGSTGEVNRGATPGAHGRLRKESRQRQREAVGSRFRKS